MEWKEKPDRPYKLRREWDSFRAIHKIREALKERFINWTLYSFAIKKINRAENGSWMFEGGVSTVMKTKW